MENEGRVVCRQKSTRVGGLETVGMETAGAGRPGEDNQRNAWIIGKSREFTRDTGLSASAQGNQDRQKGQWDATSGESACWRGRRVLDKLRRIGE